MAKATGTDQKQRPTLKQLEELLRFTQGQTAEEVLYIIEAAVKLVLNGVHSGRQFAIILKLPVSTCA